jgi:amino acid transporter
LWFEGDLKRSGDVMVKQADGAIIDGSGPPVEGVVNTSSKSDEGLARVKRLSGLGIAVVFLASVWVIVFAAGLLGLVGSFHGLILASGRSTLEFGRMRHAPVSLAKLDPRRQTPANALKFNCVIGLLALASGHTSDLILLSVFGALTLYAVAMISLLVLRVKEPSLPRPFLTPCYPFFPWIALVLSLLLLVSILLSHRSLGCIYLALMAVSLLIHQRTSTVTAPL